MKRMAAIFLGVGALMLGGAASAQSSDMSVQSLQRAFACAVQPVLKVPVQEQQSYERRIRNAVDLSEAVRGRLLDTSQYLLVVDRDPGIQAALLYFVDASGGASQLHFIGATPVSTGRPSGFDHFETPTGLFEHVPSNPDFRAEGTYNENGVRGYGSKGMRVYDFGWQTATQGWGAHGPGQMRLQMHATDPVLLEPRLGTRQSKGCIRIAASFNRLLDRYALLDQAYLAAADMPSVRWMLRADRTATSWPGRWLLVVDSSRGGVPGWARPLRTAPAACKEVDATVFARPAAPRVAPDP